MARVLFALLAGLLFGTGIAVAGMANPAKVLNFFDIAGSWDPSLAFVLGGAVIVTAIGYRLVLRRPRPLLDTTFHLPTNRRLDVPLIAGAAVFGVGWGITGFCPGGSIPALGLGQTSALVFVVSMMTGIGLARLARHVLTTGGSSRTA